VLGLVAVPGLVPWSLVAADAPAVEQAEPQETNVSGKYVSFKDGILKVKVKEAQGDVWKDSEWKVAEDTQVVGHIRGVAQMTDSKVNRLTGRALLADGFATVLAGFGGGSGTTTYGENIGVMAATRIYSTALFVVAGLFAVLLGLSPKFGALIHTIPMAVMGGISIVVFGLISVAGARIWVDNKVDFSDSRNMLVAAITLVLGTGDFTLKFGEFAMGGIGTATFGAILLNALLSRGSR